MRVEKKISVIIVIYKVAQYLRQCLESVVNQDYGNLEIVLVLGRSKDGSEDDCAKICYEFAEKDGRIKIVECQAAGVADARNRGLAAATGELIGFVDGDDYIDRDMYSHLVDIMGRKSADISVCGRYYTFKNTERSDRDSKPQVMNDIEAMEMILKGTGFYLHCWDKLYQRKLWDGIRFPEDSYVEDRIVVNQVLSRAKKIVYDSTPKYHYRERLTSLSKSGSVAKQNMEANSRLCSFIYRNYPMLKDICDRYLMYEYITAIQNVYIAGNPDRKELTDYKYALLEMGSSMRKNSCIDKSLKLKWFLALNFPRILVWNTRRKNRKLRDELVRYD